MATTAKIISILAFKQQLNSFCFKFKVDVSTRQVRFVCLYQPDVSVDNFLSGFQIKDVFSWGSTEQVKRQSSTELFLYILSSRKISPLSRQPQIKDLDRP